MDIGSVWLESIIGAAETPRLSQQTNGFGTHGRALVRHRRVELVNTLVDGLHGAGKIRSRKILEEVAACTCSQRINNIFFVIERR